MWYQPFEEKEEPDIDECQLNYCCQANEIGEWGGDPDSDARHATYDEAYSAIKKYQLCGSKILIATTLETQRNARKALKDRGFHTSPSVEASDRNRKLFLHYWIKGMPTYRVKKK